MYPELCIARGLPPGGGWGVLYAAEDLYDVIPPHHQQPIRRAGERRGGVQTYTTQHTPEVHT